MILRQILIIGLALCFVCVGPAAFAGQYKLDQEDLLEKYAEYHVEIEDNFSKVEQVLIWRAAIVAGALVVFQGPIALRMGEPLIGDPWSLDRSVSNALYRGPDAGLWLSGAPDFLGQVLAPGLSIGYYLGEALFLRAGHSLTGDKYADHEFLAFTEAYAFTLSLTYTSKLLIGRERPLYALGREALDPDDPEANLSFFSGHTSSSFCIASFVARDIGDWLTSSVLADRSPRDRLLYGRVLPSAALYGLAAGVGLSRIVDQEHYLTDVLLGALVGTVSGNLFYSAHFDRLGRPRSIYGSPVVEVALLPFPGGASLHGRF